MKDFRFNKDEEVYITDTEDESSVYYTISRLLATMDKINISKLISRTIIDDAIKVKIIDRESSEDNVYLVYDNQLDLYYSVLEYDIKTEEEINREYKKQETDKNGDNIENKPKFVTSSATITVFDSNNNELFNSKPLTSSKVDTLNIVSKEENPEFKIPSSKEIKDHLDQYVIGQEEAKINLSVAVHNHYLRKNKSKEISNIELQKSNILMIGKSGTGKTLLAETIARFLNVPFISVDSTEFSPTGIVGKSANDIIQKLVDKANGNIEEAEYGIIYIDEFDKLAEGKNGKHAVMGNEVQSTFLKLIEGTEVKVSSSSNSFFLFSGSSKTINTKNILFICGGAFSGIEELVEINNREEKQVGFIKNKIKKKEKENVWDKINQEQIIKYGLMPEIVGRLPVIVKLNPLNENDLVHILTQPKNALIKQYQKILEMDGINLKFTNEALRLIAKIAIERQIGARGLRSIIEPYITQIQFKVPNDCYIRECIIDENFIKENIMPIFRRNEKQ